MDRDLSAGQGFIRWKGIYITITNNNNTNLYNANMKNAVFKCTSCQFVVFELRRKAATLLTGVVSGAIVPGFQNDKVTDKDTRTMNISIYLAFYFLCFLLLQIL